MGRYPEAQECLAESLAIARDLADKRRIAEALQPLGMAHLGQGDLAGARRYLEEALILAQERGDQRELAAAINAMAQLHRVERSLDKAAPLYDKVLSLARELGDRESIAIGLLNLAMVAIDDAAGDAAKKMLREALAIANEIGSKPAGQSVLEVCAGHAVLAQNWQQAALFYGAAEAQAAQTGFHRDPADEAFLAPLVTKAQTALGLEAFATAEGAGRRLSYEAAMAEARAWLEPAGSR